MSCFLQLPEHMLKGRTTVEPGESRLRRAILQRTGTNDDAMVPSTSVPEPPSFEPLVDPDAQLIGLLAPIFKDRFAAGDILEDEDKIKLPDARAPPIAAYKVRTELSKQLKKRKELGMVYLDYHQPPPEQRRRR